MKMHASDSSLIAEYGYDPSLKELRVRFRSGGVWKYAGVSVREFDVFMRAPSKGKHLRNAIVGRFKEGRVRE